MPANYVTVLDDGAVYESDATFYYKLSYSNGNLKYKYKTSPYYKVSKFADGSCISDNALNFETYTVNNSGTLTEYQWDPYTLVLKSKVGLGSVTVSDPLD